MNQKTKTFIISIAIPLVVGGLSALLTMKSMDIYKEINQPKFAPPGYLFPIVWTGLYILMGISSGRIYLKNTLSNQKDYSLVIYALSLFFNCVWSIIFFNARSYLFAFIWLVILWALVLTTIIKYYKIDKLSATLQIPYLAWITFAGYLNLAIFLLN